MRFCLYLLALTACFAGGWSALAQEQVATRYPLTAREGPYLIHIVSFRGPEAAKFANNLADEIRSRRYNMQAFVYEHIDEAAKRERDALRKAQLDLLGGSETVPGTEEKVKLRTVRVEDEFAVFIGNYPTFDKASEEMLKMRRLEAPQSIPTYGVTVYAYDKSKEQAVPDEEKKGFGIFANAFSTKAVVGDKLKGAQGNPFRQAFVARNPLLRQEIVTQRNDFDPSWITLNAKEQYSIFTCFKPWTLVVARFTPPSVTQSSVRSDVFSQGQIIQVSGRGLENAAENGRKLAELLRDGGRGYDAYVFHRRQDTIVTVGAFDARDEKMEQAWRMLCEFAAAQKPDQPFSCLMKIPQPMMVPRQK